MDQLTAIHMIILLKCLAVKLPAVADNPIRDGSKKSRRRRRDLKSISITCSGKPHLPFLLPFRDGNVVGNRGDAFISGTDDSPPGRNLLNPMGRPSDNPGDRK
jgi:hypothetical protein